MRAAPALFAVALIACGGGDTKKKTTPVRPTPKVAIKKPPPPPPACIKGGDAMGTISAATGSDTDVQFCVSYAADSTECFSVELASGEYKKLDAPATAQSASLEPSPITLETTATEVKVCNGDACKTITPKIAKPDNQLAAAANASTAVVMIGDTESGKGVAEVWDVAKTKKLTTIKYAKGDFKCGVPKLLGSTIYLSVSVCARPAARGALYTVKGKKLADVGGKDFGTFSEVAVQVKDNEWAFLEENGSVVALQDVVTGKVAKTISLAPMWAEEGGKPADGDTPPMGNPGETSMVRGGDGKLLVISGSPSSGNIGVIDVASGEVKVTRAPACKGD